MNDDVERDLLRALRGELGAEEAAALRGRLAADPELRERERRLRESWSGLVPPADPSVPLGFSERVLARARADQRTDLSWSTQPRWAKLAAGLALLLGIAAGVGAATALPGRADARNGEVEATLNASFADGDGLAESYLQALEAEAAPGAEAEIR